MDDQDNAGDQGASNDAPTQGFAASSQQPTQVYPIGSQQSRRGIVITSAIAVLLLFAVGGVGGYVVHNLQEQNQALATTMKRNRATATAVVGVMATNLIGWRSKSITAASTASAEKVIIARYAKDLQAIAATQTAEAKLSNATQTAIAFEATATPTATPSTPYLTACFQENVSSSDGSCSPELNTFYQDGFNDITLSFTVPQSNRFHSSSITWRVFRSSSSGSGSTEIGSYYDNTVDPQNPGFT